MSVAAVVVELKLDHRFGSTSSRAAQVIIRNFKIQSRFSTSLYSILSSLTLLGLPDNHFSRLELVGMIQSHR